VSSLVNDLQNLLAQKLGRKDAFSQWWDTTNLQGHHQITPAIREGIKQAKIFLLVLSPGYLASDWCRQEMGLFLEKLSVQTRDRVFVLEFSELEEERPESIVDIKGYRFWYQERDSKRARTLSIQSAPPYHYEYARIVDDLATDISKQLKSLTESGPFVSTETKATVFLAEVTDDMEYQREDVRRYLERAELWVLPERRYLEGDAFKQMLEEDLAQSKLFIQLLGPFTGRRPEEIPQGYSRLQLEYAQGKPLPVLHWRDPNLVLDTIEAKDQRQLLEAVTVYAEPLETFKQRIVREATVPPLQTLPTFVPGRAPIVFIHTEKRDRPLAETLIEHLDQRLAVTLPIHEGKAAEVRKDLQEKLLDCDALIVVYGESSVSWVDKQILNCNKILSKRSDAFRALAVYDGPPEEKPKVLTRMPGLQTLTCREGLNKACLQAFIEPLLQSPVS
jgi:hypothetical protein